MVHGRSRGQPLAQVLREPVQEKAKAQPSNHSAADQATPPALGDESFLGQCKRCTAQNCSNP